MGIGMWGHPKMIWAQPLAPHSERPCKNKLGTRSCKKRGRIAYSAIQCTSEEKADSPTTSAVSWGFFFPNILLSSIILKFTFKPSCSTMFAS